MPSPIGHALGGVAAAWTADLVPGNRAWRVHDTRLTLACAALAVAPDLDLLVGTHRGATHSMGAVAIVTLSAAAVAIAVRRPAWRVASMCGAAYATHLLLDWLGADPSPPYGIQMFWPLSDRWYISGVGLFLSTERRMLATSRSIMVNAHAVAREVIVLAPIVTALWLVRVKALAGLAAQMTRGHHAPQ